MWLRHPRDREHQPMFCWNGQCVFRSQYAWQCAGENMHSPLVRGRRGHGEMAYIGADRPFLAVTWESERSGRICLQIDDLRHWSGPLIGPYWTPLILIAIRNDVVWKIASLWSSHQHGHYHYVIAGRWWWFIMTVHWTMLLSSTDALIVPPLCPTCWPTCSTCSRCHTTSGTSALCSLFKIIVCCPTSG